MMWAYFLCVFWPFLFLLSISLFLCFANAPVEGWFFYLLICKTYWFTEGLNLSYILPVFILCLSAVYGGFYITELVNFGESVNFVYTASGIHIMLMLIKIPYGYFYNHKG